MHMTHFQLFFNVQADFLKFHFHMWPTTLWWSTSNNQKRLVRTENIYYHLHVLQNHKTRTSPKHHM